jgi:S1-C subfamily serine protease
MIKGILVLPAILVSMLLLAGGARAFAQEPAPDTAQKESLYQQLSRAIIRLEAAEEQKAVGTGFFAQDTVSLDLYLVTARHVVQSDLRARVPSQRLDSHETEVIELRIPKDGWIFHPQHERKIRIAGEKEEVAAVDVAVAPISHIKERRVRAIAYCSHPCADAEEGRFLDEDPVPPRSVLVWGFPADLGFTLTEQRPMARYGMVAMVAEEPFVRTDDLLRDERVILIDAPVFRGNSGGPVFDYPASGSMKLAGLISSTNPNLEYGIAEPVSRIREALEAARTSMPAARASWHVLSNGR